MSINRKEDTQEIKEFIDQLKKSDWLGKARSWWPDFVFRFEDIEAAAKILNQGRLLSREKAIEDGDLIKDCASPAVLGHTADRWKGYVRLYFRPRTPTQYRNEGIRAVKDQELDSHCPVPVIFLFDSKDVLTRESTQFSEGNLAKTYEVGDSVEFLRSIPFEDVYHVTYVDESNKRRIIYHRNAEIIVPNEMDLSSLRYIFCRSTAECETLKYLLDDDVRVQWKNKTGEGNKVNLHYRGWTYVEEVALSDSKITFRFNPSTRSPGPFKAVVEIIDMDTGETYCWERDDYTISNYRLIMNLRNIGSLTRYSVKLTFDDNIAYYNEYIENDLPF